MDDHGILHQCESMQEDELTVLESIYPGQIKIHPNPGNKPGRMLTLTLPVTLSSPTKISISTASNNGESSTPLLTLSHLPALSLCVALPDTYPLLVPPTPILLRAPLFKGHDDKLGSWLLQNDLKEIKDRLRCMWDDDKEALDQGQGVLWKWWDWVVNGDFLRETQRLIHDVLTLTVPPPLSPATLFTALKSYNSHQIQNEFEQTAFPCSICWENRKGGRCVEMPGCGCIFCTECLGECWTLAISEGTLEAVACPSVACVKQRATNEKASLLDQGVTAQLVEKVVGKELREKWEIFKDRRIVEIDPSFCICPQPKCQAAVPPPTPPGTCGNSSAPKAIRLADLTKPSSGSLHLPADVSTGSGQSVSLAEDRWAAYRLCPKCNFSFCLYCSSTWHGPHTVCSLPQASQLVLEYLKYPEGSERRLAMERQRGKANLERMVAKWREDEMNKQWLHSRTKACPSCSVRVEKSVGCNHMQCGRCSAHFCYLCGESIKPTDPYKHFNAPGQPCYQKLFEAMDLEDVFDPVLNLEQFTEDDLLLFD
ncbi:E3 ubiquitin-protein ligase RNF14 [Cryptococcus neoformans C23]|uniref:RBR-type E3 ubiquitin transferase n=2 Tax=Cryptococcus neoformans TaxID=5207 RepID=J9VUN3_CRYN9|nr:E3 ubiquitin-protein ligase RNF14 [Cryptococcus neoformans var. grubii H99]AUB28029.1 E3 ubiquitin-protein ligase RNF14 [Cryptococcus neoformans var. grubii]OWZ27714.1 E3 ubiquitin-protein ligase RNF14 [Cryptococcus neoformans var. grubii AD2-60a]OWZ40018.1 E3 ubiquitin-protein ligase RNF14 [Cryptococcus neoformans var. grubii C23]OXC81954.1 E3 ubiquitin-protein ligase RNF14 [Cryptococcus neoformans var. grubii AD1-7a]AFR97948.1 E3 ubiquitin-protein ligase RNF14 [Cryptococcus neoformans var|eukprot:XP_012052731.1 E3 ubiquitin-protein ligase RNF14 [Cryptococcus neoformans var. grubii H99]